MAGHLREVDAHVVVGELGQAEGRPSNEVAKLGRAPREEVFAVAEQEIERPALAEVRADLRDSC
jgi:hypothetical protein